MTGSRGNTSWSKDSTLSLHNCSVMSLTRIILLLCIWREARRNKGGVDPLAVAVSRHLEVATYVDSEEYDIGDTEPCDSREDDGCLSQACEDSNSKIQNKPDGGR